MRRDMAKVVTEAPRRGHENPSKKWGRRLARDEYDRDDHGPSRAPIARCRQYSTDWKEFSDVLGPLRRYLRGQVGRPWDKVWSEITQTLDRRTLTGQHIFDHIRWEVEQDAWLDDDGGVHRKRHWGSVVPVEGLYVHPATGLLCHRSERRYHFHHGRFVNVQATLRTFAVEATTAADIRRYRVDGWRVWERRDCGWFIHTYTLVPEQLIRRLTRSDGREVSLYAPAHWQRHATKQASKKEIRDARSLLETDPFGHR